MGIGTGVGTVLWIGSAPQADYVKAFEERTGLSVVVTGGERWNGNKIRDRYRAVLIELPVASEIIEHVLAETSRTAVPLPVVIYDAESALDESLVRPPAVFRHVTKKATAEELASIVQEAPHAAERVDEWSNLLIGESRVMRNLHSMIRLIGPRKTTVLIQGETGVGKEMVARAIHMASGRADSEMVVVNCAAIPENLVEAELFGHAKGAFTGAVNPRVGHFEYAHRGTILLDEVGELPLEAQSKLLRVLQEYKIQRIGSSETIPLDTRAIAASNVDLEEAVERKVFREDLLYRLNVVQIRVPPLRERLSDVPLLAERFIEKVCLRENLNMKVLSAGALDRLTGYDWPGNVRQLEHAIEMAVTLAGDREKLYVGDFQLSSPRRAFSSGSAPTEISVPPNGLNFEEVTGRVEKLLLQEALRACGGNKAKAASALGMKRTTLLYKAKALEALAS